MCSSRRDLDDLLDNLLDKSQANPKTIAEQLFNAHCPFPCNYISYTVKQLSKQHDPRIGRDVVQLGFWLENTRNQDGATQVIQDLDYSIDMFVSDIGTIFGILMGLSLTDILFYMIYSMAAVFKLATTTTRSPFLSLYSFCKWTALAGLLCTFIITSFIKDFRPLQMNSGQTVTPQLDLFRTTMNKRDSFSLGFFKDDSETIFSFS